MQKNTIIQGSTSNDIPYLYLAPIRGLTDIVYRETFATYFKGFDCAIAPFINPQRQSAFKTKHLRDVLPENNKVMTVVPQLLHTTVNDFLALTEKLEDLGYNHINWNLGCPAPMVVHKKRGSGFLPYPDEIIAFLEQVLPKINIELSIKTRLGFTELGELEALLPRLDAFPLKEIIIHTRLGKQMYSGVTDPESFIRCMALTKHPLVYNGDIVTLDAFEELSNLLPTINRWMIGRGAIANPFLPSLIKDKNGLPKNHFQVLYNFHKDIYCRYQERLSGASHILGRMKQIWQYMVLSFPNSKKNIKALNKAKNLDTYQHTTDLIFKDLL